MKKAFGTDFVLVSDIRQLLPIHIFLNGPWIHLATVKRGLKEYMAFNKMGTRITYIEEVDNTHPGLLKKIDDEAEWQDVYKFLLEKGCLIIAGVDYEIKAAPANVPGLPKNNYALK